MTARRRRAGREFWTRLWLVGGYALGAGILDTYLAGGANSWSWDAFTASALTAGIASLALSFGVFLWETFADRVRLIGRRSIFFAAAIISIALLWARLVGGGLITPVGPQWWTIPPLVFAGFFALAVVLSAVVGRRATDAAAIADDSSWRQVQASRGLRRLAGWTVPFVVIAGLITLGAGAALGFTLMGQAIPDLLASGGPEWLYETAVRMDDVLPDAPVATGSVDRMLLYAAVLTYGVIVLRLYRDIASRSRGLAAALLVIAMVASLAVALFSPWEIVLAGFMGVTGAIGIVVIAVIGWIVLSVFS